jgi:hypothetical protein
MVDESATGSVNFGPGSFVAHGSNGYFDLSFRKFSQIAERAGASRLHPAARPTRFSLAPSTERE